MEDMKVFEDSIKTSDCVNVMIHIGCVLRLTIVFRRTPSIEQIKIALERRLHLWGTENPLEFEISLKDGAIYANAIKIEYKCTGDIIYEN